MKDQYFINDLLRALPGLQNRNILIKEKQQVNDIIKEVLEAHENFKSDYDLILPYFYNRNVEYFLKNIFDCCKANIKYEVESENAQSTKSPRVFLTSAKGDCKHYAGFIGGLLDAYNRTGERVKWFYRFAAYSFFDETPSHVFIVVETPAESFWVDPVLSSFNQRIPAPLSFKDFKVNITNMSLNRISGVNDETLRANVEELVYYDILDRDGNIIYPNYLKALNYLPNEDKEQLETSYKTVVNNSAKISGWVSDVFGALSNIFSGGGSHNNQPPPPPPPPPTFMQQYGKYIPFVIVGGVGLYLYFDHNKSRRR